jgi:hypothetical protein
VLVVYFDECKDQVGSQPYYWLCGVALPASAISEVEGEVRSVAKVLFGDDKPTKATELHASVVFNGSKHCTGLGLPERLEALKGLAQILAARPAVARIQIRIDPAKVYTPHWTPAELAFLFFLEKVDQLAKADGGPALLVGDLERRALAEKMIASLAEYRSDGTPFPFGVILNQLVDTVYFGESHHSRLLQLADTWTWFSQLGESAGAGRPLQAGLLQFLRRDADIMFPTKWKQWPT